MLDLNVDAAWIQDSAYDETDSNADAVAYFSGEPHDSDQTTFKFSILNKVRNDDQVVDMEDDFDSSQEGLQTRMLFPVAGEEFFDLERPGHWLNLAVPEMVGKAEIGICDVPEKQVTQVANQQPAAKRSRRGPRSRSSQFRGVTFYRRTGRWESHIWDCGKQVYLGGFDTAHAAARAYDRAAIKFRGVDADINFQIGDYEQDMNQMKNLTKEEFILILRRRQNTGLSRANSKYKCRQWEAQMSHFLGKKAFEKSPIEYNGREAVVNFELDSYGWDCAKSSKGGGRGGSLDLNLWSSPSTDGLMKNDVANFFNVHHLTSQPDRKSLKIEEPSTSTHDAAISHLNSVVWTSKYSGFANTDEETARKSKLQAMALPGFPNWPWNHVHHNIVPSVPYCSSAASSGFSSTNITFSPPLVPLMQNKTETVLSSELCYPPMALSTTRKR